MAPEVRVFDYWIGEVHRAAIDVSSRVFDDPNFRPPFGFQPVPVNDTSFLTDRITYSGLFDQLPEMYRSMSHIWGM